MNNKTEKSKFNFTARLALMLVTVALGVGALFSLVTANAADELICYSFHNAQGWTASQTDLPPSLDIASGNLYSRWRFNLVCNRVSGMCLPFGNGSRVFLDYDGPNGPEGEYEQTQFYNQGQTNPSDIPRGITTVDNNGIVSSIYYFNLRYATTVELFSVQLELLWQANNPNRPAAGNNTPTYTEFINADAAAWGGYNHSVSDDPSPPLCATGGIRATNPVGPVWTASGRRCGSPSGLLPCVSARSMVFPRDKL